MAYEKTQWVNNQTKLNATNMNKIENGIETNSNNMPNGINVDSDKYLILEHDGVEITGQNKKVKYPFNYNSDTNTTKIAGNLDVDKTLKINTQLELNNDVQINCDTSETYSIVAFYSAALDTVNFLTITQDSNRTEILTKDNTKTIFGNNLYGSGNIDLYKHRIRLTMQNPNDSEDTTEGEFIIYSSSNIECTSTSGATQKLKELLKVNNEGSYDFGFCAYKTCRLYYLNNVLSVDYQNIKYTITYIRDVVTPL